MPAPNNSAADRKRIRYDFSGLTREGLLAAFAATDSAVHAICRDQSVDLIDASAELTGKPQLFVDHVHLSDRGSEQLAALVAHRLADLLRSLPPQSSAR